MDQFTKTRHFQLGNARRSRYAAPRQPGTTLSGSRWSTRCSPDLKDGTWQAVKGATGDGVPFGWKNFYDEDQPVLTPQQTIAKEPTQNMISYQ